MRTWLTSDHHFSHTNVIKYSKRPFYGNWILKIWYLLTGRLTRKAAIEMNDAMIAAWNKVVRPGDRVIYLGDFAMAATTVENVLPFLNGDIELYLGNHDFPHPAHRRGEKLKSREEWTKNYLRFGFKSVQLEGVLETSEGERFRLYHLPYFDPEDTHQDGKPRHFSQRLPDDGIPLLCGHVHEKWLLRRTPKGTIQLNVGVDAPGAPWSGQYRPASLEEVLEVYRERPLP